MSERITRARLDGLCATINKIAGMPPASYLKTQDGHYVPQAGNYHVGGAYGGYRLERMSLDGGSGESDVSPRLSKAGLYEWMHAYLAGYLAREARPRDRKAIKTGKGKVSGECGPNGGAVKEKS